MTTAQVYKLVTDSSYYRFLDIQYLNNQIHVLATNSYSYYIVIDLTAVTPIVKVARMYLNNFRP